MKGSSTFCLFSSYLRLSKIMQLHDSNSLNGENNLSWEMLLDQEFLKHLSHFFGSTRCVFFPITFFNTVTINFIKVKSNCDSVY